MKEFNSFSWGWFFAWVICWAVMYFGFALPRKKTIARLEAERDSLVAKLPVLRVVMP